MTILDQLEQAEKAATSGDQPVLHATMRYQDLLHRHAADLIAVSRAARALYELVETDESVGICLSSRAESLLLGQALTPLLADEGEAG